MSESVDASRDRAEWLVERCSALAQEGLSDAVIAERLGIHPDTVTRKRVRGGVRRPHQSVTASQEAQINALADDGASVNEIARTVGVSWPTVAKRRPDAVWSMQEASEWGAYHKRLQET